MPTLGQAYVQIVPSADGISNSISDVLSGPADKAGQESGKKFGSSFGGIMKTGLKTAALGVGAAAAAGAAALGKSIADVSQYGDHVDKMSQKIGMSRSGFQKWDYVLQRAGTSIDSMAPVMKKLSTEAVKNSDAFQELGLSQEEVANMSQEELFGATIEALSGMEEGAERTALASKLLGKGASELAPLINGGTDAIKEQMEMAERYGMVMSDDSVKAAADFCDAQTTLQGAMTGFKNRVSAEFLPAATDVVNGIAKMFAGDTSGFDDIKNGLGKVVTDIIGKVPEFLSAGAELMGNLVQGLVERIPEMAQHAAEAIKSFAAGFGQGSEGTSTLLAQAGEMMISLGGALLDAAGTIIPALIDAIFTIITTTDWIGLGMSAIETLKSGMEEIFPKVLKLVSDSVSTIMDTLGFSGLVEKVKKVFEDVKEKITGPIDTAKQLVSSAVETIKGLFPISMGKIFSGIKLPHFKISGGEVPWGIGGMGTKPSVDIEWYARGGIMTKPTLFGGGEAGAEGIVPLDPFYARLDQLADNIINGVNTALAANTGAGGDVYVTLYAYPGGPQMDQQIVRSYDRGKSNGLK